MADTSDARIQELTQRLHNIEADRHASALTMRMLHAKILAQEAAVKALVSTTDQPEAAFNIFVDLMDDSGAEERHPEFVALLRHEMQEIRDLLASAANRDRNSNS